MYISKTFNSFCYTTSDYGLVSTNADGIINAHGLSDVAYGELVLIYSGFNSIFGMAFNLERDVAGIVLFGDSSKVMPGDMVFRSFSLISVPVGKALLGCVVDPLGFRLDTESSIKGQGFSFIEQTAPSIISRAPVRQPLETGLKVVDSMVPIGHGQRELIIGDMKTGKSSVALDAIINQKGTDTLCVYVAIGQKMSSVARIWKMLSEKGCMSYTVVVVASSSDPSALQFIAPYAGCAIGEFFMNNGLPVLCVYDDLSKHAVAYRQISLLLRRPPGREGYPGDVFFVHSRLLERSARLNNSGFFDCITYY